jgi:hypothetical protein
MNLCLFTFIRFTKTREYCVWIDFDREITNQTLSCLGEVNECASECHAVSACASG